MTYADIRTALLTEHRPHDALAAPERGGVYAIFLQPRGLLLPIKPGADGLLYIGVTRDGLDTRNHIHAPDSSASDLRRTLGAVLRNHLGLHPTPCATGDTDTTNFRFADDGEIILSRWMRANLLASSIPADGDLAKLEAELIADLQPPLNLAGWDNPQALILQKFRAACVTHAKAARAAA
jgi:hypothetical protein